MAKPVPTIVELTIFLAWVRLGVGHLTLPSGLPALVVCLCSPFFQTLPAENHQGIFFCSIFLPDPQMCESC